jgi:peptidoglycan hydrolase-like protein with peptidoglycan-binding domain
MPSDKFRKAVQQGDKGREVKLAQEWLCYHGCSTVVDGIFGPATEVAVKNFQTGHKLENSGVVDVTTQTALLSPIVAVQSPLAPGSSGLAELTVAYARRHLEQHPVEIGGENCGPWVRLYMGGNEGREWPWCAGFATWVLRQACRTLGAVMPHPYVFGCDQLAGVAQGAQRFRRPKTAADLVAVKPGFLFLVRKTNSTWAHVGIVEDIQGEVLTTIEGNTNDSGSAEGYEVCRRTRSALDKDYLIY